MKFGDKVKSTTGREILCDIGHELRIVGPAYSKEFDYVVFNTVNGREFQVTKSEVKDYE